jgi:glycosyltransferase involved in cell wall biosynthesis
MKRILFVAVATSPLAARWINQLADSDWDVHVFATYAYLMKLEIHPLMCAPNVTIHTVRNMAHADGCRVIRHRDLWPFKCGWLKRNAPSVAAIVLKDHLLDLIDSLSPNIVHSLKMQNETYMVNDAFKKMPHSKRPKWIYSMWGSDIYNYISVDVHRQKICDALSNIDYVLADNPRDINLATANGFKGQVLGVYPTGGGYPIGKMRQMISARTSERKVIALKGYQAANAGQALTALDAIKQCGKKLQGYKLVIHSAIGTYASRHYKQVKQSAEEASHTCGLDVEFLPYSPTEVIWSLFGQSRIALAISKSDGTPNAMLEAMCMGAFPIQSNTGGLDYWIQSGKNGLLVPHDDVEQIAHAIALAVDDDSLVDHAAELNFQITQERLEESKIRSEVLAMYDRILQDKSV